MPKIFEVSENNTCFLCGSQAFYISYNSKKMRCVEKITQCPGFVRKAEETRQQNMTKDQRREHMIKMSRKAHKKLAELHSDDQWLSNKKSRISESVKIRGGHSGKNNPMFGKKHKKESLAKLVDRANKRDQHCYAEATITKISRGLCAPKDKKSKWEKYRAEVHNYTRKSWILFEEEINPSKLDRGQKYELDHKFSITEGFLRNVDPKIIGHYKNLELIPKQQNRSKRTKCSITLEELIKAIS